MNLIIILLFVATFIELGNSATKKASKKHPVTAHVSIKSVISWEWGWPPDSSQRLIKTNLSSNDSRFVNSTEIFAILRRKENFLDLTDLIQSSDSRSLLLIQNDVANLNKSSPVGKGRQETRKYRNDPFNGTDFIPTFIKHSEEVLKVSKNLNKTSLRSFLFHFTTNFRNRFFTASEGLDASEWLHAQIQALLLIYNSNENSPCPEATVFFKSKEFWLQKSVIARFPGCDPSISRSSQLIIIGAHLDTFSHACVENFNESSSTSPCGTILSPGADDNASGSAVLFETLRAFLESRITLRRTLEFHWYAAEEVGNRGSVSIASEYRQNNVRMVGMLNLDCVGYAPPPYAQSMQIGLQTDQTSKELTDFLRLLVDNYLDIPWKDNNYCETCYSDYASWTLHQFPCANAAEITFTPYLHSPQDTLSTLNINYILQFAKLTVAYAVEFGEPFF